MIESNIGFDCDRYTNASAYKNLELASAAARELGQPLDSKWTQVSEQTLFCRRRLRFDRLSA